MARERTALAFGLRAPYEPCFFEHPLRPPADDDFVVETLFTGLSAGTELSYYKGTNPYLHAAFDAELGVFRHDQRAEGYPVERLGYMEVGRVTESRSTRIEPGELVAMAYGHRTAYTARVGVDRFVVLPDDLDPLLGVYVAHMGPICANGLLHAAAEMQAGPTASLGDGVRDRHVVVMGAGVVGLLTAAFAAHHGAGSVAVVDASARRLAAAGALGFTAVEETPDVWRRFKAEWVHGARDRGADVVFQCRGHASRLATGLRCLRPQGTVIDLAFYQDGATDLRLGEEFHHNGLTVRCAQISRVPRSMSTSWDRDRLSEETIELLTAWGDRVRAALVTDIVELADAGRLFAELAARERDVIQAIFTVDGASEAPAESTIRS